MGIIDVGVAHVVDGTPVKCRISTKRRQFNANVGIPQSTNRTTIPIFQHITVEDVAEGQER